MKPVKGNLAQLAANVFFFFNSLGLPSPLLWTNFAPLAYIKSYFKRSTLFAYGALALLFLLYLPFHLKTGVELNSYVKSLLVYFFVLLSIPAFHKYILTERANFPKYFKQLAIASILLFLLAAFMLFIDQSYFWKAHYFQVGGKVFWRYQAFSYEPSYYAFLFAPIALYFLLKTVFETSIQNLVLLLCVSIPLLATVSYGFFGVFFFSLIFSLLVILFSYRYFPLRLGVFTLVISVILTFVIGNVDFLSNRIDLMFSGEDESINGRTTEAFYLASEMIKAKSEIFGIGHGQIKILGEEFIRPYYGYKKELWPVVALPNAAAETMAVFGYLGLAIRLGLQCFIFFFFKVHRNLFSLCLFLFLFIYQFMGSFYMSGAEIAFWVLCSSSVFPGFNIQELRTANSI